jgi:hypothetical protein
MRYFSIPNKWLRNSVFSFFYSPFSSFVLFYIYLYGSKRYCFTTKRGKNAFISQNDLGEPLRALCALASGYPLHHLRASFRASRLFALRWFRYYPSRNARAKPVRVSARFHGVLALRAALVGSPLVSSL